VRAFSLALAAGNTCVLKGPELAPKCFWGIVDAFRQAGLPDGVLNLVYHRPQDASEITTALIAHPAVKKVNFTGSTAVGSIISAIAGKYLKPIITELGGKASLIVLADADIEKAAAAAAMGAFLHAGQVCMSTERVIVHASVVDKFIDAFKASTAASYDGPNTRVPTLVNTTGALKTKSLVSKALKEGAEVLFGDTTELKEDSSAYSTAYMKPVILKGVKKGTDLYVHESFGPSVAIYTFETEAEAVEIANDTEYGLAGAVFTSDLAAGIRIAKVYETGAVHINHMTIYDSSNLPHGGTKSSGFGRFSAMAGLDEWLRYKVVTYDL
jgi:acyl-CoA reductase-like NAD-dependent aldehyde dehydrogenase